MIKQLSDKMSREMTLPQSLQEALADIRPIVFASVSHPFRIVNATSGAWENMWAANEKKPQTRGVWTHCFAWFQN
jgi:hypothetical protein